MRTKKRRIAALSALAPLALALAACSGAAEEEGAGGGAARAEEPASQRQAGEAVVASAPAQDVPPLGIVGPRVIQTASLTLSVPRGELEATVERARTEAAGLGGFVVQSAVQRGSRGRLVQGTLVVRVPAGRYAAAMSALTGLGRVERREERGEDVSQEFVDLGARRRHLEAVERQLLELLEDARSVTAALAVQTRLNEVQLELEQVRGRLRYLEDQVTFATISLDIRERGERADTADGWGIVDAWRDGARAFVYVAGRTFVVLAAIAPLALLLAAGAFAARAALRRRPLRAAERGGG